jgi:hypothetical protein
MITLALSILTAFLSLATCSALPPQPLITASTSSPQEQSSNSDEGFNRAAIANLGVAVLGTLFTAIGVMNCWECRRTHCCQSGRSSQVSREFELMARYVQKPRDDATMTAANMNFSTFTPPASVNNFHILLLQPTSTTSSGFSSALPPLPTHHSRPTRVTYNQPQG